MNRNKMWQEGTSNVWEMWRIKKGGMTVKHDRNKRFCHKNRDYCKWISASQICLRHLLKTSRDVRVPVITVSEFPMESVLQYFFWKSFTQVLRDEKKK